MLFHVRRGTAHPLLTFACLVFGLIVALPALASEVLDLSKATIYSHRDLSNGSEPIAATVLQEEIQKRTGLSLSTSRSWPNSGPVIAIATQWSASVRNHARPANDLINATLNQEDGFSLSVDTSTDTPIVWIVGSNSRGALFGVGALLRNLNWSQGALTVDPALNRLSSPMSSIRGHQLGFRAHANSYDAWTIAQYDQYVRELTFFGVNSIENIPFQDPRISPVMKITREEANKGLSAICKRYGLDYWVWTPADFDLKDPVKRQEALAKHEQLYKDCVSLSGIFFPGGDPGHNPAELVLPFLEDVSRILHRYHPKAKIWLSLQGFEKEKVDYVFEYLDKNKPTWLGGLCEGPGSPPIALLRPRLASQYRLRMYPDITHNKLAQYEVPWWDQAYALVLGREAINPRPTQYAYIHNWFAPFCDGFISYSDGCHDDVNKTIWSAMGWDRKQSTRAVLVEYCRTFFGPAVAEDAADGILALEKNWRGPLAENGSVEGTLLAWQALEKRAPELESNWRWQMLLSRAYYDAYIRRKLINETELEKQANAVLLKSESLGAANAVAQATAILLKAENEPIATDVKSRITALYDALFHSIGLQSGSEKYFASDPQRGAVMDFIDLPLNNRWWLEDEFVKVAALPQESEKVARLLEIANWENPGPGGYYDNVGNKSKSTHVLHSDFTYTQVAEGANPSPTFWWWEKGKSRRRLTWQVSMDWPKAMVYEGLAPDATYVIKTNGFGQTLLRIDKERVLPRIDGKEIGEIREFDVPAAALADGKLELTFDRPADEVDLNWRQQSRLSEVWLIKKS